MGYCRPAPPPPSTTRHTHTAGVHVTCTPMPRALPRFWSSEYVPSAGPLLQPRPRSPVPAPGVASVASLLAFLLPRTLLSTSQTPVSPQRCRAFCGLTSSFCPPPCPDLPTPLSPGPNSSAPRTDLLLSSVPPLPMSPVLFPTRFFLTSCVDLSMLSPNQVGCPLYFLFLLGAWNCPDVKHVTV